MEMKSCWLQFALVCSVAMISGRSWGEPVAENPPLRVGQVLVIGNTRTREDLILKVVPLCPGMILTYPDMQIAERNLERLGIFKITPDRSIRPTVKVIEDPNNPKAAFKDILIQVEEAPTASLKLMPGISAKGELRISVVFEERNFDPLRFPTSLDDLLSGDAFRGAGVKWRVELLQISLFSFRAAWLPLNESVPLPFFDFGFPVGSQLPICPS